MPTHPVLGPPRAQGVRYFSKSRQRKLSRVSFLIMQRSYLQPSDLLRLDGQTGIQREESWRTEFAGKTVIWSARLGDIEQMQDALIVSVYIDVGSESLRFTVTAAIEQKEYYLKFNRGQEVGLVWRFPEKCPSRQDIYSIQEGGRIEL